MRRTRMSRPRGVSSRLSALFVFVLLAVALVGAGYLLGRFVLSSILSRPPGAPVSSVPGKDKGGSAPETMTATISLDAFTVYRIQVGAFSNKDNATKLAQACFAKGVPAYVMAPDPLHKVYCGVLASRQAAEKMAQDVMAKISGTVIPAGDKLYIGALDVPAIQVSVSGDKQYVSALDGAVKKAGPAIQALLGFWDSYYLKTAPVDVKSAARDLASALQALKAVQPPENLRSTHSACVAALESLSKALAGAEAVHGGDASKGPEAMTEFMKVVDILASFGE